MQDHAQGRDFCSYEGLAYVQRVQRNTGRGHFLERISIVSIFSSFEKSSGACAIRALAISPLMCASRPASSSKVSKTPYIPGAILRPYHVTVFGSLWLMVAP